LHGQRSDRQLASVLKWGWGVAQRTVAYVRPRPRLKNIILFLTFIALFLPLSPSISTIEEKYLLQSLMAKDVNSSRLVTARNVNFYYKRTKRETFIFFRSGRDKIYIRCVLCPAYDRVQIAQIIYADTKKSGRIALEIEAKSGDILLDRHTALNSIREVSAISRHRLTNGSARRERLLNLAVLMISTFVSVFLISLKMRIKNR